MIYLSKLAKRLALVGDRGLGLVLLVVLAGCSSPEERDFLSPDPGAPKPVVIGVTISPRDGSVPPGQAIRFSATGQTNQGTTVPVTVQWSATGGTIQPDGTFVPDAIGRYTVRAALQGSSWLSDSVVTRAFNHPTDILDVTISPDSQEVGTGEALHLVARAEQANGAVIVSPPLEWRADGGSVDGDGWFRAPPAEGVYTVTAVAASGIRGKGRVKVRETTRTLTGLDVSPNLATVAGGQTRQFTANGIWSDGTSAPTEVLWSSTGGGISAAGLYTAGSTAGHFRVVGRTPDGLLADTSVVTVTEPTLVAVMLSPRTLSVTPGASHQLTAQGRMSDGSIRSVGAAWQATGGTISPSGTYTAGSNPGGWRVIASVAGTGLADTAQVTISIPSATLTSLVLNPGTVSVPAGATRQFAVVATWSDGSVTTPQVSWDATGGTISGAGLYTAGTALGTYRVIAREATSGRADTSTVSVTSPALQSLVLNPSSVTLAPGQSQQFQVAGLWSDGGTAAPSVSWHAPGGTISTLGLFTAGSTAGTWPVIATHAGSGKADTSWVTVDPPAATLLALTLTPASAAVQPGQSVQFSVTATWSGGGSGLPPLSWSATGGTVSGTGLYTAGSAPGSYAVIVTHAGGSRADTSVVTVSPAAPVLTSLSVSPKPTAVPASGSRQFAVSATWSDGSTTPPGVTWSATGGTITNGGLYVAPNAAGTFWVTAAHTGGTLRDSAQVTVSAPPQLVGVQVTPDSVSLASGASQTFTAVGVYDQGGTAAVPVAWSATGGTINASGVYTAGGTGGTFRVIAAGSGFADTSVVVVQAPAPVVTSFVLTPGSASAQAGATVQFSTSATWSDGVSRPVTVTYSATGGSITAGGLYTAGAQAGTFLVIAACGCGITDTSTVAIAAAPPPPPTVTSFAVAPKTVVLETGGTTPFTTTTTWSDGATRSVVVSWSATGGTVSGAGVYTAGSSAGSYRVIASCDCGWVDTATVTVQAPAGGGGIVYFEDDFSSGDFSKSMNGFRWGGRQAGNADALPVVTTVNPYPGKAYSAQFQYGGNPDLNDDAWSELRFLFGTPLTEYYLRVWVYFPSDADSAKGTAGYYHRTPIGPSNNKFWTSWSGTYSSSNTTVGWGLDRTLGASPAGGSRVWPYYMKIDPATGTKQGSAQWGMSPYDPFLHMSNDRGRWVKIQMHFKSATTIAASDGMIRLWKDGVLVQNATGLPNAAFDPAKNGHVEAYIMGWANSGFDKTTRVWLGPVKLSSVYIPD